MTVEHIRRDLDTTDPFSTELAAPRRLTAAAIGGNDQFERMGKWIELFMGTAEVAKHLAQTAFVPDAMNGKPADIAAAMMRGLELGIDPLDALSSLYVIKGRVGFSAEFMRRRVLEAGHEIIFDEQTDERCKVRGRRKGSQEWTTVVFTKQQAQTAGVQNMLKFPADMLVARATSRLCRRVFPDVLSGAQIVEDIVDGVIIEVPTDDTAPAAGSRQVLQRKPRQSRKAAAEPAAPAPAESAPSSDIDEFPGDEPEPAQQPDAEQPPAAGEPEEPPTGPMNKKMHVLFRDAGLTDRDDRLAVTSAILGFTVDTSSGLTKSEGKKLIDTLDQWQTSGELEDQVTEILNRAALAAENKSEGTEGN